MYIQDRTFHHCVDELKYIIVVQVPELALIVGQDCYSSSRKETGKIC